MPNETHVLNPPLRQSLFRGLKGRCPACGKGKLFGRFLKPVDACSGCGRDWTVQTADDFPAYLSILLAGHVLVPLVVEANLHYDLPLAVQMALWPAAAAAFALALIQPMKGFVIALIWAR